jgi:uncharacterized protein
LAKKEHPQRKHIPLRTCIGCRQVLPKRTLIRIVKTTEGVKIDPTGKLSGRGAYLHDRRSCWETGLKGALAQALKTELTAEVQDLLKTYASTLNQSDVSEE